MWRVAIQGRAALHERNIIDFYTGNTDKVIRWLTHGLGKRAANFIPGNIEGCDHIDIANRIAAENRKEQPTLVLGVLPVIRNPLD